MNYSEIENVPDFLTTADKLSAGNGIVIRNGIIEEQKPIIITPSPAVATPRINPAIIKGKDDWEDALEKESDKMYAANEWQENKAFRNGAEWLFDYLRTATPKPEVKEQALFNREVLEPLYKQHLDESVTGNSWSFYNFLLRQNKQVKEQDKDYLPIYEKSTPQERADFISNKITENNKLRERLEAKEDKPIQSAREILDKNVKSDGTMWYTEKKILKAMHEYASQFKQD